MQNLTTFFIAGSAVAGVVLRPFRLPEAIWACAGALLLLLTGILSFQDIVAATLKGGDVYMFLVGMMLLSEVARRQGLFDWLAASAVKHSRGSSRRLFIMLYLVGVLTTTFLSNDATAVVLTPAVYAAARAAKIDPLPSLFACAFVANAASFVLPISNPANIVLYAGHTPALLLWLERFALPSFMAVLATFFALWFVERRRIEGPCETRTDQPKLSREAKVTFGAIIMTALVLLVVAALDVPLGAPTLAMGLVTAAVACLSGRQLPWPYIKGISWSVLPLVAGLFALVAGVEKTGAITLGAQAAKTIVVTSPDAAPFGLGLIVAIASNLINNLPAGLIAATTIQAGHLSPKAVDALLIGVDLGPNFSVTGSLATILWLQAIRREGENVGFLRFLKVGLFVTPPALLLALGARLLVG